MIARYFSNYPDVDTEELKAFQLELRNYMKEVKSGGSIDDKSIPFTV